MLPLKIFTISGIYTVSLGKREGLKQKQRYKKKKKKKTEIQLTLEYQRVLTLFLLLRSSLIFLVVSFIS